MPTPTADLPFGLRLSEATPLPGEVNRNLRLTAADGRAYLLKIYPDELPQEQLNLQTDLLRHLHARSPPFAVPTLIRTLAVREAGGESRGRLFDYLPGRPVATTNPRTPELYTDWGRCCGTLSRVLSDFDHPAARRTYRWDPLCARRIVPEKISYLNLNEKKLAEYFLDLLASSDLSRLPRSVCYNDAHEHNLLTTDGRTISGVIDFDDVVHTATICELAIGCAYAAMHAPDPLAVFRSMTAGYVSERSASVEEIDAVYPLIVARLLLTVVHAAEGRALRPDNAYLTVSETAAWELLGRLRDLSPTLVRAHLRSAARFPVHPAAVPFANWAASTSGICPVPLPATGTVALDLRVGSTTLGSAHTYGDPLRFTRRVRDMLEEQAAILGVGGYGEVRPFYDGAAFRGEGNSGRRHRSVHLGLDFWSPTAGVAVRAVCAGRVEMTGRDTTPGGYGHVILLRHQPTPELSFLTLYGHLGEQSVRKLGAGTQVQAGQVIGVTGTPADNGGWPPHLHFQILLDDLGYGGDFPGVAFPEEADIWLALCPDPRSLISEPIPAELPASEGPRDLQVRRRKALGYSLSLSYRDPLLILRGWRQELYDYRGRRYLDTVNNVAHVGHEHPEVVRAAGRQSAVLNTNSRYLHPLILEYAEALIATLPDPLSVVHFVNSGSEANELALRMARAVTGRSRVLAFEMGYHGNTGGTVAVSSYKFDRKGGRGAPADTRLLPYPDLLRHRNLDATPHLPADVHTFIHESILSCAGQRPLPPGYLAPVYAHVRSGGGVCIADEVQTGLGRTGQQWWAFEEQGVVPDIVTMGKPLGNGHPLGAVVCTPRVARAFANGMEYFNTFGGNPVSAATGLAVLRAVNTEGLRQQATQTGNFLRAGLRDLSHRHPIVADVRGSGLFLGIELCRSDLSPATRQAAYLTNRMRELGILTSTDGPHENVLKIKPPLCFNRADAKELLYYLERVLGETLLQI